MTRRKQSGRANINKEGCIDLPKEERLELRWPTTIDLIPNRLAEMFLEEQRRKDGQDESYELFDAIVSLGGPV